MAVIVGIVLFRVKYEVVGLESQHKQVKRAISATNESIHLLRAEWAHLNDPKRVQLLAAKYLNHIKPLKKNQMVTFHDAAGGDKGYDRKALEDLIDAAVKENKSHKGAV